MRYKYAMSVNAEAIEHLLPRGIFGAIRARHFGGLRLDIPLDQFLLQPWKPMTVGRTRFTAIKLFFIATTMNENCIAGDN